MQNGNRSARAVLLVEDDVALRTMLIRVLTSWGLVVRHADSLETAVRAVYSWGPFDAVISDYSLPDGSGLVFKNWLREQIITIPFLLISGAIDRTPLKPSARFDFLSKPFSIEQLRATLGRLLPDGLPEEQSAAPIPAHDVA